MSTRVILLPRPTADAVRRIAQGYLADAARALDRLGDRKDGEALHDFRVAVRRLRSLLRAYRRWVGRAGTGKVRARLRDLGAATNAGRDAEVQIAWLEAQRGTLARGERTGLNWILRRLRTVKRESYTAARRQIRQEFGKSAELLGRRLAELGNQSPPLRETFGLLLRRQAADLETRLAAIRDAEDEKRSHQARISAKRLRYLLEPLRRESEGVRLLVDHMKALQDLLGELHDAHVLERTLLDGLERTTRERGKRLRALALEGDTAAVRRGHRRDEQLGLVALAGRVRARRDALFAELDASWLHARGRPFFVEAATLAEQSGQPLGVPIERERKFLLRAFPEEARAGDVQQIEQGWLPGDRLRERVRRIRDAGRERYYRTVKLGAGIERIEIEEETTAKLFAALWPLTEGCRIAKRRYRVPAGPLVWEVDEFLDRELVLAEVELPRPDVSMEIPAWVSPVLEREVTGNPAYLNLTLASTPGVPAPPTPGASLRRPAARRARSRRRSRAPAT
jgi:CHAD domain-containing protein/CYTH domain-containing protein